MQSILVLLYIKTKKRKIIFNFQLFVFLYGPGTHTFCIIVDNPYRHFYHQEV